MSTVQQVFMQMASSRRSSWELEHEKELLHVRFQPLPVRHATYPIMWEVVVTKVATSKAASDRTVCVCIAGRFCDRINHSFEGSGCSTARIVDPAVLVRNDPDSNRTQTPQA